MQRTKFSITRNGVLRFFLCLAIAFVLWLFVMYTENPEYEQTYTGIEVEVLNSTEYYEYDLVVPDTITAKFRGTNVALASCSKDQITAVVDLNNSKHFDGVKSFPVSFRFEGEEVLTPLYEVRVGVSYKKAEMAERIMGGVPVEVLGMKDTAIEGFEFDAKQLSKIKIYGRAAEVNDLSFQNVRGQIKLTADDINRIVNGLTDGQAEYTMSFNVQFENFGEMTVTTDEGTAVFTEVTFRRPSDK